MRFISLAGLALLFVSTTTVRADPAHVQLTAPEQASHSRPQSKVQAWIQLADTTCFYKYEQVSGMNKICYYDCLGSLTAITIGAVDLCPLTITE